MITPQRAPVRPRVKRKGGDTAFLLEEEIAELASKGRRGIVLLRGEAGCGKSTALKHLAEVLPIDRSVGLLDSSGSQGDTSEMDVVLLATDKLVVTTLSIPAAYAEMELELVPWGQDEWIEFLLACHPAQCKSVMARLLAGDETRSANFSAANWRVVLEEMAADETVASPLDAMICRLSKRFSREQQLALSPLALDEMRIAQMIPWPEAVKVVPDIDRAAWRLLNQPLVLSWVAAAYAVRLLKLGLVVEDARCLDNCAGLPRSYLYNLAALVRGDQQATCHLYRVARSNVAGCHATAVSVLHLAGAMPPPATGNRPDCGSLLTGAILEGVQWPGVSLDHMDLCRADFSGANLFQANLDAALAGSADFSQADLRQASLRESKLLSANFAGANLSRVKALAANFTSTDCRETVFNDAYLCDATFQNANLTDARFRRAQLAEATLLGAVIDGADFTGANLTRVNLNGRNLAGATFRDAIFTGATLVGCVFDQVELPSAMFNEANLANATFTGASMPRADFRGAILRGCGLADVDWEGADLRNADLRGAVFSMGGSRSGLVGSPYPGHGSRTGFYTDDYNDLSTHKHPEEIRKANLCGADLRGANIEGVDFYLVDLRGALYDPGQAEQLRRCGAILREPVA